MPQINNRAVLAEMISLAICDALTVDSPDREDAITWLHLREFPNFDEIYKPSEYSFIYCCRRVGLNWHQTWMSVKESLAIPEPKGVMLRLVYTSKPCYNLTNDQENSNAGGARKAHGGNKKLHNPPLSLATKPS